MKKYFKTLISLLLVVLLNCGLVFVLSGCRISTDENGLVYNPINKGKEYEVYAGSNFNVNYTEVVIPETHKGKPVTKIVSHGFHNLFKLSSDGLRVGQTDKIKSIHLPSTIKSIGDKAFYGCDLEKITADTGKYKSDNNCIIEVSTNTLVLGIKNSVIPEYVESIDANAFLGCAGLESIEIPSSVTYIGNKAFYETGIWNNTPDNSVVYADKWVVGCKGNPEKTVSFQSGTVGIANFAFYSNDFIEKIVMPDTIVYINDGAFYNCNAVKEVLMSSSIKYIGKNAFAHFGEIENIVLPSSIISIGEGAFSQSFKLKNFTLPSSVTSIGDGILAGCRSLESINVDEGNSVYKSDGNCIIEIASNKLISGCKNSVIPPYITEIGDYAFYQITHFTSIEIPSSVISIGNFAFFNCAYLENVTIPTSVKSIGSNAFAHCSLGSIIIPISVTTLGEDAFNNSHITIYVEATSKPKNWSDNWNKSNCPVVWGYSK